MDTRGDAAAPAATEEARASWKTQLEELKHEAEMIQPILEELYPELFPPKFVADEFSAGGKVAAGLFAAYKLLRIVPLNEAVFTALRQGMLAAAGLYLGWRLASGCLGRLAGAIQGHRRRRRAVMRRWQALTERIERLQQLAEDAWGEAAAAAAPPHATASATAAAAPPAALPAASVGAAAAAATDALSSLESAGAEISSSSLEIEESLELSAGVPPRGGPSPEQQQHQQQQQQPPHRAGWGSGLAGWSQLYGGRAGAAATAAAPRQQQQGAAGAPFPGGSPVLLQTPWNNEDADEDEEEWEQPQFASAGAEGSAR